MWSSCDETSACTDSSFFEGHARSRSRSNGTYSREGLGRGRLPNIGRGFAALGGQRGYSFARDRQRDIPSTPDRDYSYHVPAEPQTLERECAPIADVFACFSATALASRLACMRWCHSINVSPGRASSSSLGLPSSSPPLAPCASPPAACACIPRGWRQP